MSDCVVQRIRSKGTTGELEIERIEGAKEVEAPTLAEVPYHFKGSLAETSQRASYKLVSS